MSARKPPRLIEREPDCFVDDASGAGKLPCWVVSLSASTLRAARVRYSLTLRQAAEFLDVEPVTLGEIERGKLVPADPALWSEWDEILRRGAKMLGCA